MGLMNEYINQGKSGLDLEAELLKLIGKYTKLTGNELLVYSAAISKQIPNVSLGMDDYYIIVDLLRESKIKNLDVYIETPGGSGEAAEEIVNYFHSQFSTVNFIVSGEAKSAGTIIVMSGNEISMTKTGSLGPIDAQVGIGRGQVSAHDYMEWVDAKQKEAIKNNSLSPFDATMIAQISPGELNGVSNALEYARDLVIKWLPMYKFKNWNKTETRGITVTPDMKMKRAEEIAKALTDHTRWRSHGRSLKISDLEDLKIKINTMEKNPEILDIINRIQVVIRLLYSTTNTYKIFATKSGKIFASATTANPGNFSNPSSPGIANNAQIGVLCPRCGRQHKLYTKFKDDPKMDEALQKEGLKPFPKDNKLVCDCGFEQDLTGLKNQIEADSGRKVIE